MYAWGGAPTGIDVPVIVAMTMTMVVSARSAEATDAARTCGQPCGEAAAAATDEVCETLATRSHAAEGAARAVH